MIELRNDHYAIEQPADAWILKSENYKTDFVINMGYITYPTVGKKKWFEIPGMEGAKLPGLDYNERSKVVIKLPPGTWEIVCTSNSATEEQAKEVVGVKFNHFPETVLDEIFAEVSVDTYRETLDSLLTSKGCDLSSNWLILKKQ